MPHNLETWKQVLYLCNKEDHVFRLVYYVSNRYSSNPRYACTMCSTGHNSETEGVWRCADMDCDDDYCQKCWTEKVLKEFFMLQRKHVEPTLTTEDLILMEQNKKQNREKACERFFQMWKEDMQEKMIKKLSKTDLAKF